MPRTWIINNDAARTGEVLIRGRIGDWMIEAGDIAAQLNVLSDATEITVRINSRGGQVDHAIGIFNQLREHPARIIVRIEALAASAASLIAMAGDEIIMPANALMMIHNPWTYAEGDAEELRKAADALDKTRDALVATYMARTGKTAEEIQALLDAETYMTAQEAVDLGFADRVEAVSRANAQTSLHIYAAIDDIPESVLARMAAALEAAPAHEPEPDAAPTPEPAPETTAPRALARHILHICNHAKFPELAEVFMSDDAIQTTAQADAALASAQEIRVICQVAHLPEAAAGYIQAGLNAATVKQKLFDRLIKADAQIDNTLPMATAPVQAGVDGRTIYRNRKKKGE